MEDAGWIAVAGVLGTLLGSVGVGIVTYFTSKMQNKARLDELARQIKHQESESRRNRLIEERKPYLPKLKEAVSNWKTQLTQFIGKIDGFGRTRLEYESYDSNSFLGYALQQQQSKPDYKKFDVELGEIQSKMDLQKEEIEILRGETCDVELGDLIDDVLYKEKSVSASSWPILHRTFQLSGRDERNEEHIREALDKIRETTSDLRENLQKVSKRIEELLIGDESRDQVKDKKKENIF